MLDDDGQIFHFYFHKSNTTFSLTCEIKETTCIYAVVWERLLVDENPEEYCNNALKAVNNFVWRKQVSFLLFYK